MKNPLALFCAAAAIAVAVPAIAKTEKAGAKASTQPRWAHAYAAGIEEAKERGCIALVTFHIEH